MENISETIQYKREQMNSSRSIANFVLDPTNFYHLPDRLYNYYQVDRQSSRLKTIFPKSYGAPTKQKDSDIGKWDIYERKNVSPKFLDDHDKNEPKDEFCAIYKSYRGWSVISGAANDEDHLYRTLDFISEKVLEQNVFLSWPPGIFSESYNLNPACLLFSIGTIGCFPYIAFSAITTSLAMPQFAQGHAVTGSLIGTLPITIPILGTCLNSLGKVADKMRTRNLDDVALSFQYGPEAVLNMVEEKYELDKIKSFEKVSQAGIDLTKQNFVQIYDTIISMAGTYSKLIEHLTSEKMNYPFDMAMKNLNEVLPKENKNKPEIIKSIIDAVLDLQYLTPFQLNRLR